VSPQSGRPIPFTGVQATEAVGFESAKHMTNHISKQWQLAAHSVKHFSPDKVMEAYYSCIEQMCCQSEKQLNYLHMSAIVYGTSKVWTTAAERHSGWVAEEQAGQNLRSFIARMLKRLHPLLPAVGARLTANVLWSSAKLGLNPDALVPGMTDGLAQQFMADMDAANGQDFATVHLHAYGMCPASVEPLPRGTVQGNLWTAGCCRFVEFQLSICVKYTTQPGHIAGCCTFC